MLDAATAGDRLGLQGGDAEAAERLPQHFHACLELRLDHLVRARDLEPGDGAGVVRAGNYPDTRVHLPPDANDLLDACQVGERYHEQVSSLNARAPEHRRVGRVTFKEEIPFLTRFLRLPHVIVNSHEGEGSPVERARYLVPYAPKAADDHMPLEGL